MHHTIMNWLRANIPVELIKGKRVVEVGSVNVNGTPRELFASHAAEYIGVDFAAGAGVDVVLDVAQMVQHFGPHSFDVVISTEMLEHVQDWRTAVTQMKMMLRGRGLLVVTSCCPGFPYHGYPHDYWRYTVDDFLAIFADLDVELCDTHQYEPSEIYGVLLKGWRTEKSGLLDLSTIDVLPVEAPP